MILFEKDNVIFFWGLLCGFYVAFMWGFKEIITLIVFLGNFMENFKYEIGICDFNFSRNHSLKFLIRKQ